MPRPSWQRRRSRSGSGGGTWRSQRCVVVVCLNYYCLPVSTTVCLSQLLFACLNYCLPVSTTVCLSQLLSACLNYCLPCQLTRFPWPVQKLKALISGIWAFPQAFETNEDTGALQIRRGVGGGGEGGEGGEGGGGEEEGGEGEGESKEEEEEGEGEGEEGANNNSKKKKQQQQPSQAGNASLTFSVGRQETDTASGGGYTLPIVELGGSVDLKGITGTLFCVDRYCRDTTLSMHTPSSHTPHLDALSVHHSLSCPVLLCTCYSVLSPVPGTLYCGQRRQGRNGQSIQKVPSLPSLYTLFALRLTIYPTGIHCLLP